MIGKFLGWLTRLLGNFGVRTEFLWVKKDDIRFEIR
jgi:hypothetical protein